MLLQVHANRQDCLQLLHLGEGDLQFPEETLALLFRLFARGDVARDGVDELVLEIGGRIPQQPSVRAVLADIAVLE